MTARFAKGTKVHSLTNKSELDRFMLCDGCRSKWICSRSGESWLCWICRYENAKAALDPIGTTFTLEPIPMMEETKAARRRNGPAKARPENSV